MNPPLCAGGQEPITFRQHYGVIVKFFEEHQFRIKNKADSYYSYITTFKTSGEWQEIEIPLKELYPSFRGRKLDMPNFSSTSFEEIVFLIGNKKNENFKLLIDKIELK